MEALRILLISSTAALGFVALGLGGFVLAPSHARCTNLRRRDRSRERQTPVA
jgi:hypothetical protein